MKNVSLSELIYLNFDVDITDIFPENWSQRKEFALYKNKARPCSALFFVCSNTEVLFFYSDGTPAATAKNGDVVFIPKGSCYYVKVLSEISQKIDTYTVNLHFFDEMKEEFLLTDKIAVLGNCQDSRRDMCLKRLSDVFHRVNDTCTGEKRNLARTKGEFFLLLDTIESAISENDDFYYPIRKGAKAFCEDWNKNKKIEEYAQMSGVSETYFYRCFKKWSGSSPIEYRNMLRLSNAESLLRCTDMKIRDISLAIGFDDPFYFCRLFSYTYGLSPKHYRIKHQKRIEIV